MSYPPPPGVGNLPPRQSQAPPPSQSSYRPGFQPAFPPSIPSQPPAHTYSSQGYQSTPQYHSHGSYSQSAAQHAPPGYSSTYGQRGSQQGNSGRGTGSYQQSYPSKSYGTPNQTSSDYSVPQIRNPFQPPPANGYAAEEAAQIAQWQNAYVTKDALPTEPVKDPRTGKPVAAAEPTPAAAPAFPPPPQDPNEKKKTVVREGGGKKWQDDTLVEWDPSHLRLFVGNLAGETTDDSLLKAFSRWKSVQKARVVRDKRTTKSKGYGFVSFSDADDFFQAAREMNGKYIQSHPVVVKKANTEIKVSNVKEHDRRKGGKKKNGGGGSKNKGDGQNSGNGLSDRNGGGGYEPGLGPIGVNGVTKPGQKTKNGMKFLG